MTSSISGDVAIALDILAPLDYGDWWLVLPFEYFSQLLRWCYIRSGVPGTYSPAVVVM